MPNQDGVPYPVKDIGQWKKAVQFPGMFCVDVR